MLGIKLSWNKRYITLAPVATVLGLAFKLFDPDNLIGDQEELGITCALIPVDHDGVEIGERHNPLGMAFMNGRLEAMMFLSRWIGSLEAKSMRVRAGECWWNVCLRDEVFLFLL